MHGLRLIRFAGKPEASNECQEEKGAEKPLNNNVNVVENTNICGRNVKKEPEKKRSGLKAPKKDESLNQLFRLPPFGANSSLKILRRPRKVYDHKSRKTKVSLTKMYSDKIKDALKKVGRQKDKINTATVKSPSRRVVHSPKNEVKVIFTSQNWKTKRKPLKPLHPRRSNLTYVKSKSSLDFQGLNKNDHLCCRLQLPWKSRQNKYTSKKKSALMPCHAKNCRNFLSDSMIKSSSAGRCKHCTRTPSVHYNLVDFPFNAKDRHQINRGSVLEVKANTSAVLNKPDDPRSYRNKEVSVTPSILELCLKAGGDTFEDKASQVIQKKKENEKLRRIRCLKAPQAHKTCAGRKHNKTHISVLLANTILKYIIFGLSIVVWSPCICITFLIWIITYPMRPQEIIDTVNNADQRRKHKKCHRNNEFLAAIYESSKKFTKKISNFYETVFDLLKTNRQETGPCCKRQSSAGLIRKHNSNKTPNPNKKYTLFYNDARGWVIKPIKSANVMETGEECEDMCLNKNEHIPFNQMGIFGKTNLQPDQACQVNFTFGQLQERNYNKKSKFSLQCLKMSQAFHNKGQKIRSKPKHKKCIKTQAFFDYDNASTPEDGFDTNVVICRDTCDVQTNFLDSARPDVPVYATLQCRKNVKFETEYPECDPCILHPHPIKRFFCSNNVTTNEHLNRPSSFKILKKINPQQNPPKYIKVKKYDKGNNMMTTQHIPQRAETTRQFIPQRVGASRQFIPKRVDSSRQFVPKRVDARRQFISKRKETMRQFIPSRREKVIHNNPKRNDTITRNVPKPDAKRSGTTGSKYRSNIRKPRKKWFKNASVGTRFHKKMSYYADHARKNIWNYDKCETLYVQTLRKKPCYWIFRRAPSFYPYFMIYYKFYENIVHGALIIMTACIWCPIFFWCYSCAVLLCRCL